MWKETRGPVAGLFMVPGRGSLVHMHPETGQSSHKAPLCTPLRQPSCVFIHPHLEHHFCVTSSLWVCACFGRGRDIAYTLISGHFPVGQSIMTSLDFLSTQNKLAFTELYYSMYLTSVNLFVPPMNPMRQVLYYLLSCRWSDRLTEKLSNLPNVTQLICGWPGFESR
jgi:hypothetical protein